MFRSHSFLAQERHLRRSSGNGTADDGRVDSREIEQLFQRHLRHLPPQMCAELCAGVVPRFDDRDALVQRLADLVDLLWMEYDGDADPLERQDWEVVRDVVDEYAPELEMDLVQYVMERVVEHRAL